MFSMYEVEKSIYCSYKLICIKEKEERDNKLIDLLKFERNISIVLGLEEIIFFK